MKIHLPLLSNEPRLRLSGCSFILLFCGASLIASSQQSVRGIHVDASRDSCSSTEEVDPKPAKAPRLSAINAVAGRWALAVGVDSYYHKDIRSLGGAWNDATALSETLEKYGKFNTRSLVNASRTEILSTLEEMAKEAKSRAPELLVFSISGHGFIYNAESYVLPSDVTFGDQRSLINTSLRTSEIKAWIKRIGAKQVIILLDVCLVEIEGELINPKGQMQFDWSESEGANITTVYATQIGYASYENSVTHTGYFTSAVVQGLRGSAANSKGEVSLRALYEYVSRVVPQQVCRNRNGFQKPFETIEGSNPDTVMLSAVSP
jgi:hypothetical protein